MENPIVIDQELCLVCGACVGACPANAMSLDEHALHIQAALCTLCERCLALCPVGALSLGATQP